MPHKATSFNTTKRAKLTILGIVVFSSLYNVPHLFISDHENWQCLPYGTAMDKPFGQFYYWLSFIVNFALPFVLLLTMNSVIICKLRKRNELDLGENVGHKNQGQCTKVKNSEFQTYAILFLVTFAFLLLTTPAYVLFLFIMLVDFFKTPKLFGTYFVFYNVSQKLYFTNCGINFLLYVISGQKFRRDLIGLFSTTRNCHKFPEQRKQVIYSLNWLLSLLLNCILRNACTLKKRVALAPNIQNMLLLEAERPINAKDSYVLKVLTILSQFNIRTSDFQTFSVLLTPNITYHKIKWIWMDIVYLDLDSTNRGWLISPDHRDHVRQWTFLS